MVGADRFLETTGGINRVGAVFQFPCIRLVYVSPDFASLNLSRHRLDFYGSAGVDITRLQQVLHGSLLSLHLLATSRFLRRCPSGGSQKRR